MAEPARKPMDFPLLEEEPGITLQRWVEGPGGRMELVETPLTPELFLNPRVGDQMTQGRRHHDLIQEIYHPLKEFFLAAPDVLVTSDLKHRFGRDLPQPSPDISVIRGVRDKESDRFSFDTAAEGVLPCLIVEVVSPLSSRIRETDLKDKADLYRRVGIPEYLIFDSQLRDRRLRLLGYRLGPAGYQPVQPDGEGRLLSETTGLWFRVSPDGNHAQVFEHPSGRLLPAPEEAYRLGRAAEEKARAVEEENARLRAEIARLHRESER